MPSPLKNIFPGSRASSVQVAATPTVKSSATSAKASAAKASRDTAGGETFENELVRRRRTDAADKEAPRAEQPKAEPSRRAEPKRKQGSKKTDRATPGDRGGDADGADQATPSTEGAHAEDAKYNGDAADDGDGANRDGADATVTKPADKSDPHEEATNLDVGVAMATGGSAAVTPKDSAAAANAKGEANSSGDGRTGAAAYYASSAPAPATAEEAHQAGGTGRASDEQNPQETQSVPHGGLPATVPAPANRARAESGGDGHPSHDDGGKAGAKAPPVPQADDAGAAAAAEAAAQFQLPAAASDRPAHDSAEADTDTLIATATAGVADASKASDSTIPHAQGAPASADAQPSEARFASANHENIVTSMRAEVLPNGGSMRIRLDPPQLGALQVTVQIRDGQITASFETSSDEATRLLGHSLNQLKSVLESQGVAVDKLQVTQAPREPRTASQSGDGGGRDRGGQSFEQEQQARQEQQRRQMLQRMWRRLSGQADPIDVQA